MRILVPLDFSKNSEHACNYAMQLAADINADVTLLHVFQTGILFNDIAFTSFYAEAKNRLEEIYHSLSSKYEKLKIERIILMKNARPATVILQEAKKHKSDIIIIGTSGKNLIEKFLLGTDAQRVLRRAACTVIAVPENAIYNQFHKVIYATDLKEDNFENARRFLPCGSKFNSEISFLFVDQTNEKDITEDDIKNFSLKIKQHITYPKMSAYLCNNDNVADGIRLFMDKFSADGIVLFCRNHSIMEQLNSKNILRDVASGSKIPVIILR